MKKIIRPKKGGIKYYLSLLILLVCSTGTFGQSRPVTGKVVDSQDGLGLVGVAVYLKGTQSGTVTDIDGNFTIMADEANTLVFSFIGYVTQEIPVGARTTIDVSLEVDVQELSEVVVIGYGKVEKGDVTGVVNKIDSKTFNKGMLTTPDQLIAGKAAGVQITSNNGTPGGQTSIRIRGGTSIAASNEPLFVVDGVPLDNTPHNPGGLAQGRNPLNFINPADIADITILKDASAAAIYGSRGANGVIIITTKSGKSGKPQFTYDGSFSISSVGGEVDMLSTEEFIFGVGQKGPRNLEGLGNSDTDWTDEILQNATSQNHNLSASFGGKNNSGRVSVNYQELNGVLKTSLTERLATSASFNQNLLGDDLKIQFNLKSSWTNDRFAPDVIGAALIFDPTQTVFANTPETGGYFEWGNELSTDNPVSTIDQTFDIGKTSRHIISGNIEYNIPFIEGLSAKFNYAYDYTKGDRQNTKLETLNSSIARLGDFFYEQFNADGNLFEAYINYNKELTGLDSKVEITTGYSYQDFFRAFPRYEKPDTIALSTINIDPNAIIDESRLQSILNQEAVFQPIFDQFENRLISFWGRMNFTIKDKYLITTTLRRDGSTRFAESNRWGMFPSLALGWRVIDESFMDGLGNTFSDLKLRLSYGITGNQEIPDYIYLNLYEPGGDRAQYIVGNDTINTIRPNAVDPNIKWEETSSLNLGLDYGFFDGRIYGSIDLYRKNTNDLLFEVAFPIGTLTGDQAITNIGEVRNQGIEFLMNSIVIDKEDLRLNIGLNAAYNENTIIKLDNSNLPDFQGYTSGGISGDQGQTIQIQRVGIPLNSFFVYEHIIKADGRPVSDSEDYNNDGTENDLDMYVDQNNDGIINEDDLRPFQKGVPDWVLGLTANLNYKQFDMAMTLRGQLGASVYNNVESNYGSFQGLNGPFNADNVHVSAFDNDFTNRQLLSDIYVQNASFLRLDNITIGYNFKEVKSIRPRAYFTASNLLTITDYSGLDPEIGSNGGDNNFGIDNNLYPRARMFLLGISLTLN